MYPGLLMVDVQVKAFMRIVSINDEFITVFTDRNYPIKRDVFEVALEKGIIQVANPYHFMALRGKINEEQFIATLV